jgi:hypothetical protein
VLDTQGVESCWPGPELFSTSATKGDVVESDSKFIEHVPLDLLAIFVDCKHRLKPDRRSKCVLFHDRNRRRPEEMLVPLDAPLEIGNCQGVVIESRKRRHSPTLYIPCIPTLRSGIWVITVRAQRFRESAAVREGAGAAVLGRVRLQVMR